MRITFYLFTMLALSGCGLQPKVTMLGPPEQEYDPVPLEDVWVFASADRVRVKHQPIARIDVHQTSWDDGIPVDENLLHELKAEAGKVGAHAIVLGEFESSSRVGIFDVPMAAGGATAIRFVEPDFSEAIAAAESPRELRTIVVAPLAIPEDISVHDSIVQNFVRDIYLELETAGFHPLPYETWESVWAEIGSDVESLVDPATGLKNEEFALTAEQRILRTLVEDYGADGFLFPDIVGVQAGFWGDEAEWDGVKQKVGETRSTGAKVVSGILNLLIRGGDDGEEAEPTGRVSALSLVIEMENTIGAHLYTGRGGIELIEEADFEGGIYIGEKEPEDYEIIEVPDELLFQKQSRLQRAVRIAFDPLVNGG